MYLCRHKDGSLVSIQKKSVFDTGAHHVSKTKQAFDENAHVDFSNEMSYGDYLDLSGLLSTQHPLSDSHDELLFIVIHQSTELWMKLIIHEITGAIQAIRNDHVQSALKMLSRVSRIQAQMIQSWDVLSTMTPADYLSFRDSLGKSSGFQSYQYRIIEYALGNKNPKMLSPHKHSTEIYERVRSFLESPSLYDEAIRLLARKGFAIPEQYTERDWVQPYEPNEAVQAAWNQIYHDSKTHWELYELAEKLVDLEDWFQQWRFRHMKTVQRIIGFKKGTGGTAGVSYLKKALDLQFFPELWDVRSEL